MAAVTRPKRIGCCGTPWFTIREKRVLASVRASVRSLGNKKERPDKLRFRHVPAERPRIGLWYAKILSGFHLTEMLALICSASLRWQTARTNPANRKYFSAGPTVCHPDSPCLDSCRTQCAHWILFL